MKRMLIGLSLSLFFANIFAAEYKEGAQYFRLKKAQPVQTGKQIEVRELFWYGCPHCYRLEPSIQKWLKNKPANADYIPMPAVLRETWVFDARAYYTFETLGILNKAHIEFFDEIHKRGKKLRTPDQLASFTSQFGIKKKEVIDAYNSFAVDTKLRHAKLMVRRYEANGVPTMIVDGKYRATATSAGGHDELMQLVNFLIKKSAAERTVKSKDK